jgi:hypothetical protein
LLIAAPQIAGNTTGTKQTIPNAKYREGIYKIGKRSLAKKNETKTISVKIKHLAVAGDSFQRDRARVKPASSTVKIRTRNG